MEDSQSQDRLRILLAEYDEIGRCWRHDVDVAWRSYALMFPVAFALVYYGLRNTELGLLVGFAALVFIWFPFLIYNRQGNRNTIRWARAHQIERILCMDHHLAINRRQLNGKRLRIKYLLWWLLLIFHVIVTAFLGIVAAKYWIDP